MAGWPGYWEGLSPMYYATHAVSPLLALAEKEAELVYCMGSGRIADRLAAKYGSPFAVESAREYVESFDVYADQMSFEWQQLEAEQPVLFTSEHDERVQVPDYAHLLPESIRKFTTQGVYDNKDNQHLSFKQGSGHGGSHPHLAHEFVRSIVKNRAQFPDVFTSANWTCAGICAHESALKGGEPVRLPIFREVDR